MERGDHDSWSSNMGRWRRRAESVRDLPLRRAGSTAVGHRMTGGNRANPSYTWSRIWLRRSAWQQATPRCCTSNLRFTILASRGVDAWCSRCRGSTIWPRAPTARSGWLPAWERDCRWIVLMI